MKHIFIINPNAGMQDRTAALLDRIKICFDAIDTEFYVFVTETAGHATEIVKTMCGFSSMEHLRFYACGGDGTLFEVVNGISDFAHTEVAMLPTGRNNDVLAIFGDNAEKFEDLSKLVQGRPVAMDALRVNNAYYALNKVCFGLDARIAIEARKKLYTYLHTVSPSLFAGVLTFRCCFALGGNLYDMDFDGQAQTVPMHFAAIMNASRHYARFFQVNDSSVDAGKIKAIAIKSHYDVSSIAQFQECEAGSFPAINAQMSIFEGANLEVKRKDSGKMLLSMDGESSITEHVSIRACPGLINFVVPSDLQGDF